MQSPSFLQRLPVEIRRKIWNEAFPVQVVHLERFRKYSTTGFATPGRQLRASICRIKDPEKETYEKWKWLALGSPEGEPLQGFRHDGCLCNRPTSMIDIRPLRLCKQFYDEIHEILYKNTIFAFFTGEEFGNFISGRNQLQLEQIGGLPVHCDNISFYGGLQWLTAMKLDIIRNLKGLKKLYIYVGTPYPYTLSCLWRRFHVCPLEEVYLIVEHGARQVYSMVGKPQVEAAESLRTELLRNGLDKATLEQLEKEVEEDIRRDEEVMIRRINGYRYEAPGQDFFG